jgi:ATP-dependent HslUV protease ATP-binding subunit HslU
MTKSNPAETYQAGLPIENMTPREIVAELDKFVVGQHQAKRAVAIALRNRWRRQQLPPELAQEIAPKNIPRSVPPASARPRSRRRHGLARAPFVEASKFTEVGYVGRDVESMIRDLVEIAVGMVRDEKRDEAAATRAEDRLLQLLVPRARSRLPAPGGGEHDELRRRARSSARSRAGALDQRRVEIEVEESATPGRCSRRRWKSGIIKEMLPGLSPQAPQGDGRRGEGDPGVQQAEKPDRPQPGGARGPAPGEGRGLISGDDRQDRRREGSRGPDARRRLPPIVEGTTVSTKYGMSRPTILFIAAGAFHVSKPWT